MIQSEKGVTVMKCREYGESSRFPVCKNCAYDDKQRLLDSLTATDKQLQNDKKKLAEFNLTKFKTIALTIITLAPFIILIGILVVLISYIINPLFQVLLFLTMLFLIVYVIFLGLTEISPDYVDNTLDQIDTQFKINANRRRLDSMRLILNKLRDKRRIDDTLKLAFKW